MALDNDDNFLYIISISFFIFLSIITYILIKLSNTGISTKESKKITELDCTINLGEKYTCSNPINNKIITLKNGPIFKLSSSTDIDSFGKATINYYILGSLTFMTDKIISVSMKVININTLDDLLKFFNDAEDDFNTKNTIPDKCLNVSTKIRQDSKPPYNQICVFLPGLNKIDSISQILEKTLFPFLSTNILNDYYNMVNLKITNQLPLTILEYVMYLALLNKIKNSQFKYFTLCTSDNEIINC